VEDALNNPDKYMDLRRNARQTIIDRYDLETVCLPQQIRLLTNSSFRTGSGSSATLSPI
jgi:hypothetical protein